MAAEKPWNYAANADFGNAKEQDVPYVDLKLLQFLEETHPPRCYDHTSEKLEDHIFYAGQVELVAMLRRSYDEQIEADVAMQDYGDAESYKPDHGEDGVLIPMIQDEV